jgi:hypothetical protein
MYDLSLLRLFYGHEAHDGNDVLVILIRPKLARILKKKSCVP